MRSYDYETIFRCFGYRRFSCSISLRFAHLFSGMEPLCQSPLWGERRCARSRLCRQPPPANADGQIWRAVDGGGTIAVYGSYLTVVDTFEQYRNFMLNTARDDGVDITYNVGGHGWFVYSGYLGDKIVYAKVVRSTNCSETVANHIYLQYPVTEKLRYDPIVTRMAKTLRNLDRGACG